ncbi:MAG: metal-dependent hydrolase [Flavobacteriales bacterium]|jgi:L-ascorbate metabolism protein UlaG (beta-lactamase superfamily)
MKITYYGHSCFGIEVGGKILILDPFISPNELAKTIDVNAIKADFVLLSHGHGDHVADAETIARNNDATVVSTYEIATYYAAKNLKYHPMNIGGSWDFGHFKVKCVNAVHSSVLPDGTYAGNPMGFVISTGDQHVYYSGDTALTYDMKLIAEDYALSAAFLCMGDNFTMGLKDAVKAAQFVNAKRVVAMHFDTFPYIKIDHAKATEMFKEKGIELIFPEIGQSIEL